MPRTSRAARPLQLRRPAALDHRSYPLADEHPHRLNLNFALDEATDPPYGTEFLHIWPDLGPLAYRVLKPGAFCLAYAGHLHMPVELVGLAAGVLEYWWLASAGAGVEARPVRPLRPTRPPGAPAARLSRGRPEDLTQEIATTTSAGRLVFTVLAAVAEMERELITEQVKAGMDRAKARGRRLGLPPRVQAVEEHPL